MPGLQGGVVGSFTPETSQGATPSPSAANPVLACIYAPDAAFSGFQVPATAYIVELLPCMVESGTGIEGGPPGMPGVLPVYSLMVGLRSLLEDAGRRKVVLGCAKVRCHTSA